MTFEEEVELVRRITGHTVVLSGNSSGVTGLTVAWAGGPALPPGKHATSPDSPWWKALVQAAEDAALSGRRPVGVHDTGFALSPDTARTIPRPRHPSGA